MDPNPGPFFYPPSSAANIVIKIRFIDKIMPLALSRVEIVNRLLKSSKILFTIERICIHQGTAKDQVAYMTDHTIEVCHCGFTEDLLSCEVHDRRSAQLA